MTQPCDHKSANTAQRVIPDRAKPFIDDDATTGDGDGDKMPGVSRVLTDDGDVVILHNAATRSNCCSLDNDDSEGGWEANGVAIVNADTILGCDANNCDAIASVEYNGCLDDCKDDYI
jgi:hypothetical protein